MGEFKMTLKEHELDLIRRIDAIGQFSQNGLRAPHKPLLLILALTRISQGSRRELLFSDEEKCLRSLLEIAGNRNPRPEYPFYYLTNDGLWSLGCGGVENVQFESAPSASALRKRGVWGAFPEADYTFLRDNPDSIQRLQNHILVRHFPESIFEDIFSALIGNSPKSLKVPAVVTYQVEKPPRSSSFRQDVLLAYKYRCALCGFGFSLADRKIGVEAAHIRWHAMGGPCDVENGMALCYQHHKLFDLGIFTIRNDFSVEVSPLVNCWEDDSQRLHSGKKLLTLPEEENRYPLEIYLNWHRKNVFKAKN